MTVDEMWAAFAASARLGGAPYRVVAFGDSAALIEELAALVVAGPKRATTSLARWYGPAAKRCLSWASTASWSAGTERDAA